jgi:hypothetical protein
MALAHRPDALSSRRRCRATRWPLAARHGACLPPGRPLGAAPPRHGSPGRCCPATAGMFARSAAGEDPRRRVLPLRWAPTRAVLALRWRIRPPQAGSPAPLPSREGRRDRFERCRASVASRPGSTVDPAADCLPQAVGDRSASRRPWWAPSALAGALVPAPGGLPSAARPQFLAVQAAPPAKCGPAPVPGALAVATRRSKGPRPDELAVAPWRAASMASTLDTRPARGPRPLPARRG